MPQHTHRCLSTVLVVSRDTVLGGAGRQGGQSRLWAPGPMHKPIWRDPPASPTSRQTWMGRLGIGQLCHNSVRELSVPLSAAGFMGEALAS
jgi:hypothetical protein